MKTQSTRQQIQNQIKQTVTPIKHTTNKTTYITENQQHIITTYKNPHCAHLNLHIHKNYHHLPLPTPIAQGKTNNGYSWIQYQHIHKTSNHITIQEQTQTVQLLHNLTPTEPGWGTPQNTVATYHQHLKQLTQPTTNPQHLTLYNQTLKTLNNHTDLYLKTHRPPQRTLTHFDLQPQNLIKNQNKTYIIELI